MRKKRKEKKNVFNLCISQAGADWYAIRIRPVSVPWPKPLQKKCRRYFDVNSLLSVLKNRENVQIKSMKTRIAYRRQRDVHGNWKFRRKWRQITAKTYRTRDIEWVFCCKKRIRTTHKYFWWNIRLKFNELITFCEKKTIVYRNNNIRRKSFNILI